MVYVCNYSNLLSHQRSKKRGINCLNKMFAIWMQKLEAVSQSFLKNLYSIKNLQTEWFWPVRLRDIKFCLKTSTRARSALKMVESGITWSWLTSIYSFKKKKNCFKVIQMHSFFACLRNNLWNTQQELISIIESDQGLEMVEHGFSWSWVTSIFASRKIKQSRNFIVHLKLIT